jgi:hypothetical protein
MGRSFVPFLVPSGFSFLSMMHDPQFTGLGFGKKPQPKKTRHYSRVVLLFAS